MEVVFEVNSTDKNFVTTNGSRITSHTELNKNTDQILNNNNNNIETVNQEAQNDFSDLACDTNENSHVKSVSYNDASNNNSNKTEACSFSRGGYNRNNDNSKFRLFNGTSRG